MKRYRSRWKNGKIEKYEIKENPNKKFFDRNAQQDLVNQNSMAAQKILFLLYFYRFPSIRIHMYRNMISFNYHSNNIKFFIRNSTNKMLERTNSLSHVDTKVSTGNNPYRWKIL